MANNYLSHSEAQAREKALQQKQACTTDECRQAAQKTINELNQLDTWRDAQIQTACTSPSSSLCQGLTSALQIAKASYTNYDPKADINGSVAGERSQVNSQAFQYQQRVDNPFAYGVGKGLLKLSPPGLVAGAGYGAYTLTSAILENGLEATAISIAKGIVDLPYELKARLNSTDPTVRGEALVDVIALGSSTAYLTQKLGMAVVNTADQAIAKAVAKAAETSVVTTRGSPTKTLGTPDPLLSEADYAGRGTVRVDLTDHIVNPQISGKQISGGHDIYEFNMLLNKAGGTVISKVETGPGIYEIYYQLPIANKPSVKTVFDPVQYPDMDNMANIAANRGLLEYQRTGNAAPIIQVNGVNFDIRIAVRPGEPPSVRTAFPVGSAK